MSLLKPQPLRRGDAIGIVAPAGPVKRRRIDRAQERLRARGFQLKTYADIYRSNGYLAGDDATRAEELLAAFTDPDTTAVWCARGGYGVVRLLERIDFHTIHRHAKVFIGFSDITALHIAIQQHAGLVTFHGPNLQDGFGKTDDISATDEAALWRAVLAEEQLSEPARREFDLAGIDNVNLRPLTNGVAKGRLTGGNLAVLTGLMGTPFEIDTAGRILFLEDVNERAYRIDRYLAQLRLAGKLQSAAGFLLGSFSFDKDEPADSDEEIAAVLEHYLADLDIPVLAGFPAGHARHNLTLPLGATIELNATEPSITLLESPVAI